MNIIHVHPKNPHETVFGRALKDGELTEAKDKYDHIFPHEWRTLPAHSVGISACIGPNSAIIIRPA